MTRTRASKILEKAKRRLKALRYLNPTLNLGNGLNVDSFGVVTEELQTKLNTYNALVEQLDELRSDIEGLEKQLAPKAERLLTAVGSIYGKDSDEYDMVRGNNKQPRQTSEATNAETDANSDEINLLPTDHDDPTEATLQVD